MEEQNINNYPDILSEQQHVEVDEFLQDVDWQNAELDGNWLDLTEHYVRPQYTLSYNGVPFAPLGGIHGLTGQPGHGKTFTFTQIMVAIMRGDFYGLKYELSREIPNPKVLYIDTEMEKGNTQLVMLRVYQMMGWTAYTQQDQFKILWLREEVKATDRWRKTLKAIHDFQPTVVFLDGLIDVIGDFNDNKECQNIIYQCMATASHYKISIWCLLHENPGSEKMVGHAGSFLERKATDVLKTKKDKGSEMVIFSVEQKKARSRDLDKWQFVIDDDEHHYGSPRILQPGTTGEKTDSEPSIEEIKHFISPIGTDKDVSITNLRERMKKEFGIGSTKAKEYIDKACNLNLLTVRDNKLTANPEDMFEDKENKLPF
jgi:hypothetical protein